MLKELELEDLGGLNIFIGPNGTGKSTVLHALATLLQSNTLSVNSEDYFRLHPGSGIVFDGSFHLGKADIERALADVAIEGGVADPPESVVEKTLELLGGELHLKYDVEAPREPLRSVSANRVITAGQHELRTLLKQGRSSGSWIGRGRFSELFYKSLQGLFRQQKMMLPTGRAVPSVFQSNPVIEVSSQSIGQWLLEAKITDRAELADYLGWLQQFLPHARGVLTPPAREGQFGIRMEESDLPGSTPASLWSSGTAHLALILLGMAALPQGSIMMIEEPELSLHPRAIWDLRKEIHRVAGEERIQFFITTHSPWIAEGIEPETEDHTLWRFSRGDDGSAKAVPCRSDQEVADAIDSLKLPSEGG